MKLARSRPAAPVAEADRREAHALIELAFGGLRFGAGAQLVSALAFYWLLLPLYPLHELTLWMAVLVLVAAGRLLLAEAYRRRAPAPDADVAHWRRRFIVASALGGLAWSLGPVLLIPSSGASGIETLLLAIALLTVCAVATQSLAAESVALRVFTLAALAPVIVLLLLLRGDYISIVAGLFMVTGTVALLMAARSTNANARARIRSEIRLTAALAEARSLTVALADLSRENAAERERLSCIIEGTNAGTSEWHLPSDRLRCNEGWAAALGYRLQDLEPVTGRAWLAMLHTDDRALVEREIQRHLNGETLQLSVETRVRHRHGNWVWMLVRGRVTARGDAGEPLQLTGTHIDITEQRRNTESLKVNLALIDALFETTPVPVVLKGLDGRYQRFNRAYAELLSLDAGQLQGARVDAVVDPAAARLHREMDARLLAAPGQVSYEVRQTLPGGRVIDALVNKASLVGPDGRVMGLVGTVIDITLQKAATRELAEAKAAAEAANRAKSAFLATMSHELRTPLTAVLGAAQLLKAQPPGAGQREFLLNAIERSGAGLLGLIENILDLSRIEAGAVLLHRADFHLVDTLEAALSTAAVGAQAKRLQLACIVEPALPAWRHGDGERLRQVVLNLLGNAVKFTPEGEITLRAQAGAAPDQVRISVTDTGIGIAADALARVFEPFSQADHGSARRFGGSGLGLTIVRQLVEAMGGRVRVASTPGRGSCFTLELPLPAAHQPPVAPAAAPSLRVAFFEPHDASAEGLHALLQRIGCLPQRLPDVDALRAQLAAPSGTGADFADRADWLLVAADDAPVRQALAAAPAYSGSGRVLAMIANGADIDGLPAALPVLIKPVVRSALASHCAAAGSVAAPPPAVAAGTLGRLLVVEDDAVNRAIVSGLLVQAGYAVHTVADGRQALQWLAGHAGAVDAVLMDWQMPIVDGLEVTRRLRAGAAGRAGAQLPIIALTANAFAEDRAACLAAGMNDFLSKPVVPASLFQAVARWAAVGRARGGVAHADAAANAPDIAAEVATDIAADSAADRGADRAADIAADSTADRAVDRAADAAAGSVADSAADSSADTSADRSADSSVDGPADNAAADAAGSAADSAEPQVEPSAGAGAGSAASAMDYAEPPVEPTAPAAPGSAAPPPYDPAVLGALPLARQPGGAALIDSLIDVYRDATRALLQEVARAQAAGDRKGLQRQMHTLKSSSAAVGALELGALAVAQERLLRAGEPGIDDLAGAVARAFDRFEAARSAHCADAGCAATIEPVE